MVKISFKFPDLAKKLKRNEREIYLFIAANMQTNRSMLFNAEGAYNGHKKWKKPLLRQGMALQKTGTLRKSIGPTNDGNNPKKSDGGYFRIIGETVIIGTSLGYARLMNDGTTKMPGGVMRPVNAIALKIPIAGGAGATKVAKQLRKSAHKADDGTRFIFRKSVKIPAREFDQWNTEDQKEMEVALKNKITEILNRG